MRTCLLSNSEAIRLEQEGLTPSCTNHTHVSFADAMENVMNESWRWVNSSSDLKSKRRVTPTTEFVGFLPKPCVMRGVIDGNKVLGVMKVYQCVTR